MIIIWSWHVGNNIMTRWLRHHDILVIISWHVGDKMLEISWQDRWPAIQGRKLWASSLGISSASSQRKWKHELSIVVNFDIDNGNVKGEWILSTMFWQTMLAILSWYCHKNHENHHDNVGDKESETTIVKKPPNVDSSCSSVWWPRIICDVVQWFVVVNARSLSSLIYIAFLLSDNPG